MMERTKRLRDAMQSRLDSGRVPAIVAAVQHGAETEVFFGGRTGTGPSATPVTRDAIFRISSMSKPITAAATMILVEEEKLDLDAPIDVHIPELARENLRVLKALESPIDDTVAAERAITARHLLTFTMGAGMVLAMPGTHPIQREAKELALDDGPPAPAKLDFGPDEYLRRLARLPLLHQPGSQWAYNTSADVLGMLVGRVAKQPFGAFLEERLFAPLGMKDTAFWVPAEKQSRFTTQYLAGENDDLADYDRPEGQWSRPPQLESGAGGLVSTVDDMLAFGAMLLADGGKVLSKASVDAMTQNQLTADVRERSSFVKGFFESNGWGFGGAVLIRDNPEDPPIGAYGWDGGLGSSFYVHRADRWIGVLLTNRSRTSPSPPVERQDFWKSTRAVLGVREGAAQPIA